MDDVLSLNLVEVVAVGAALTAIVAGTLIGSSSKPAEWAIRRARHGRRSNGLSRYTPAEYMLTRYEKASMSVRVQGVIPPWTRLTEGERQLLEIELHNRQRSRARVM